MPKILQDAFWGEISIFEKKLSQGKFEKYLQNFLVDVDLIDHCAMWCDAMWCDAMWCDAMWCNAM